MVTGVPIGVRALAPVGADPLKRKTARRPLERESAEPFKGNQMSNVTHLPPKSQSRNLRSLPGSEFVNLQVPPREVILGHTIRHKEIVFLHGWRGTGKSWMLLQMACAIAGPPGDFLGWAVGDPRRVVYFDGELPIEDMQERLRACAAAHADESGVLSRIAMLSADYHSEEGFGSIDNPADQRDFGQHIEPGDVVIFDSIVTLARSLRHDEAASWDAIEPWFKELRSRGVTVIYAGQQGKNRDQRGLSSKEDLASTVISLDNGHKSGQRFYFDLKFTKDRVPGKYERDRADRKVTSYQHHVTGAIVTSFAFRDENAEKREQAIRLAEEGSSIRAIAKVLHTPKSTVARWLKTAGVEAGA